MKPKPVPGSLRCAKCEIQWPWRDRYRECPFCGSVTRWSSAHPDTTAESTKRADEMHAAVQQLRSDMCRLEDYAAKSPRLLSFPIGFGLWPQSAAASDASRLDNWRGAEGEAQPAA